MSFKHLVFDLDDTLLDTYGSLVPQAAKEACLAMIEKGLNADISACLQARHEISQTADRVHLFESITTRFGVRSGSQIPTREIAAAGFRAFYDRQVETTIELFTGVRQTLRELKTRYSLHLVTAGHPTTQQSKLDILKIEAFFDSVTIVNTFARQTKFEAFRAIQAANNGDGENYLSIGNRLDTDIAPAKRLGWRTCWVRYGEYSGSAPANQEEKPDFTIDHIQDLTRACQL